MAELAPPWRGEVESGKNKMVFFIYILRSQKTRKYYIGCTNNLKKRVKQHNQGQNISTMRDQPWQLIRYKTSNSQEEAYKCEKLIKSYKGGNAFKKIISGEVAEWSKAAHC